MGDTKCLIKTRRTADLAVCPRCKRPHVDLPVFRLPGGPLQGKDFLFHLWATCPQTGAPILIVDPNEPIVLVESGGEFRLAT